MLCEPASKSFKYSVHKCMKNERNHSFPLKNKSDRLPNIMRLVTLQYSLYKKLGAVIVYSGVYLCFESFSSFYHVPYERTRSRMRQCGSQYNSVIVNLHSDVFVAMLRRGNERK